MLNESYDQIIPTAWPVAYGRTFSDIPFSQEIFDELVKIKGDKKNLFDTNKVRLSLAPQFEARHKLIDKLIIKSGVKQILEIASGVSARGLILTEDKDVNFVELDLPAMMAEKKSIIAKLIEKGKVKNRPNLHLEEGNALNQSDFDKATRHFKKEPVAVINEGLLRYLNFNEKGIVAENVRKLLERFGGLWITPDISMKRIIGKEDEKAERRIKKISELTGRDISKNLFDSPDQAQKFFENLGFSVERHNLTEITDKLISPQRLNLSKEEVNDVLEPVVVFVMRIK
jgi:O-methyltransferase involved in polyketide biosynthesis